MNIKEYLHWNKGGRKEGRKERKGIKEGGKGIWWYIPFMEQSSSGKPSFLHWTVFEMHRTEASKVRAYTVLKPSSILKCHHLLWQKIVKLHS